MDKINQSTDTETVLLDENVLAQLSEDTGIADIRDLLVVFIDELATRRNAMVQAIAQRDLDSLALEAHTLKSGAATVGLWVLYELAVQMDAECKEADLASALVLAQKLLPCVDSALAALKHRCLNHNGNL